MLAIASAILINAACILGATTKDTADVYLGQRLLAMVGAVLIVADLYPRLSGHIRRVRAEAAGKAKADAEPGAAPEPAARQVSGNHSHLMSPGR